MKYLVLALMTLSTSVFANSIECELTRNDFMVDEHRPTSIKVSLNEGECQKSINIPNTQSGKDEYNYEVCLKKNDVKVKVYPGNDNFGNGLFKAALVKDEFSLKDIRHEIALIQNVTILCR